MWDDAASVDMKIGFDPVIADYEVGLHTITECRFFFFFGENISYYKGLKCFPPSPMEQHDVLLSELFMLSKHSI